MGVIVKVIQTNISDVKIIEPNIFGDERGFFSETWNQSLFNRLVSNKETLFVQDNHLKSSKGFLGGLHGQTENTQGKIVRVIYGEVFDWPITSTPILSKKDDSGESFGNILSL